MGDLCFLQNSEKVFEKQLIFQHFNLKDAISYLQSSMGNKFGV